MTNRANLELVVSVT